MARLRHFATFPVFAVAAGKAIAALQDVPSLRGDVLIIAGGGGAGNYGVPNVLVRARFTWQRDVA